MAMLEDDEEPPPFEDTVPADDEEAPPIEQTQSAEQQPPPPVKRIVTGPEAEAQAMEEELANRHWYEKLFAGIGSALDLPALRMKQFTEGLAPADELRVRGNRAIASTVPGAVGNLAGNVAALGPLGGRLAAAKTMQAAPAAIRGAARVAAPAAAGAATTVATQPTLPGESELEQAGIGAAAGLAGAGVGAALPKIVRGAGALLGSVAGSPAGKATREAVKRLIEAMHADGLDPAQVLAQADELASQTGKPVTLGDVIGDKLEANRTRALLQESLATAEGPERAGLIRGIEERSQGQQERVAKDLAKNLGASEVPRSEAFEQLAKTKAAQAEPLYKKAFANEAPIVDENIVELFDRPAMVDAMRVMAKAAANRGEKIPTSVWSGDPAKIPKALLTGREFKPGVPEIYTPNLRMLDNVKRALYDIEQDAMKTSQVTGKPAPSQESGSIGDMRRRLTKILDEDVAPPEYKQARKIWGDYSEMEQVYKQGATLWKHDPAEISKMVKNATPAERDAFASGVFAQINEGMTSKEQLDWAGNHLLRDRKRMAQLRAAFGDGPGAQKAFDQFEQALQAESAAMRSMRTYPPSGKSMHVAGMNKAEIIDAAKNAASGRVLGTLMSLLRRASGGVSKRGASEISTLMHTPVTKVKGRPSFQQLSKAPPAPPFGQAGVPGPLDIGASSLAAGPLEFLRRRDEVEAPPVEVIATRP